MKVKFLTLLALGAFAMSSCVKNEESDGVKAIREAQAGKIDAEAAKINAETEGVTLANAVTKAGQDYAIAIKQYEAETAKLALEVKQREAEVSIAGQTSKVAAEAQKQLALLYSEQETVAKKLYDLQIAKMEAEVTLAQSYETKGLTTDEIAKLKELKDKVTELKDEKALAEDPIDGILAELLGDIKTISTDLWGVTPSSLGGLYDELLALDAARPFKKKALDEAKKEYEQASASDKPNYYEAYKQLDYEYNGMGEEIDDLNLKITKKLADLGALRSEYTNYYVNVDKKIADLQKEITVLVNTASSRFNTANPKA